MQRKRSACSGPTQKPVSGGEEIAKRGKCITDAMLFDDSQ
jgi:hypothetical protein